MAITKNTFEKKGIRKTSNPITIWIPTKPIYEYVIFTIAYPLKQNKDTRSLSFEFTFQKVSFPIFYNIAEM